MTLKAYEECTKEFRDLQSYKPKTCLFLSWIGKHNPVISSTIARWLKEAMKDAGIDISILKSHSVRGAVCSKAARTGVTTKQILEAADWSAPSRSFIIEIWMGMTKLSLAQVFWHPKVLQTIRVDMKRSLPKCNLRMTQGTKCLHAILRKVKVEISTCPSHHTLLLVTI